MNELDFSGMSQEMAELFVKQMAPAIFRASQKIFVDDMGKIVCELKEDIPYAGDPTFKRKWCFIQSQPLILGIGLSFNLYGYAHASNESIEELDAKLAKLKEGLHWGITVN